MKSHSLRVQKVSSGKVLFEGTVSKKVREVFGDRVANSVEAAIRNKTPLNASAVRAIMTMRGHESKASELLRKFVSKDGPPKGSTLSFTPKIDRVVVRNPSRKIVSSEPIGTGGQLLNIPTKLNPTNPLLGAPPAQAQSPLGGKKSEIIDLTNREIVLNNTKVRIQEIALAVGKRLGIPEDKIHAGLNGLTVVQSENSKDDKHLKMGQALGLYVHGTLDGTPARQIRLHHKYVKQVHEGKFVDLPQVLLHEIGHFLKDISDDTNVVTKRFVERPVDKYVEEAAVELLSQGISPNRETVGYSLQIAAIVDKLVQAEKISVREAIKRIIRAGMKPKVKHDALDHTVTAAAMNADVGARMRLDEKEKTSVGIQLKVKHINEILNESIDAVKELGFDAGSRPNKAYEAKNLVEDIAEKEEVGALFQKIEELVPSKNVHQVNRSIMLKQYARDMWPSPPKRQSREYKEITWKLLGMSFTMVNKPFTDDKAKTDAFWALTETPGLTATYSKPVRQQIAGTLTLHMLKEGKTDEQIAEVHRQWVKEGKISPAEIEELQAITTPQHRYVRAKKVASLF